MGKNIYETCLYHEILDEESLLALCIAIGGGQIVKACEKAVLDWLAGKPGEEEMKCVLEKLGYDIV
ncbi:MAG: hypothetical protein LBL52_00375 [Rickettsiales bacterium]|nr:hypothetical protein [Rickettsiales bacterium]